MEVPLPPVYLCRYLHSFVNLYTIRDNKEEQVAMLFALCTVVSFILPQPSYFPQANNMAATYLMKQRGVFYGSIYTVIMFAIMISKSLRSSFAFKIPQRSSSLFITSPTTRMISPITTSPLTAPQTIITTRLFSAKTTLSFDPSEDIRDKATSTLVIGRHSTLKSLIDKTDSYVSLESLHVSSCEFVCSI